LHGAYGRYFSCDQSEKLRENTDAMIVRPAESVVDGKTLKYPSDRCRGHFQKYFSMVA